MKNNKSKGNEFLFNPLYGLSPIIIVSILQPFFGLNIALHIGMLLSVLVLMKYYFSKEYSNQAIVLINLFIITTYQFVSRHIFIIPSGTVAELLIYHGLILFSLGISFFLKAPLFSFFNKHFVGSSKHLESNLREFYFISKWLIVVLSLHVILYFLSFFVPFLNGIYKLPIVDYYESGLLVCLVHLEIFRIKKISKLLALETFWPIVNNVGVVVGKVAQCVSLIPSNFKEMHPVVRVHFIHNNTILMFRSEGPYSDGKWDCAISEHVLYGETMEHTIIRTALDRYGINNFKPHFLLKHVVEQKLEKQYILLYYTSQIKSAQLVNPDCGHLKYWPIWQIEENLQKGVLSEAFEIEYDYLKNTVFIAEQFSKDEGCDDI